MFAMMFKQQESAAIPTPSGFAVDYACAGPKLFGSTTSCADLTWTANALYQVEVHRNGVLYHTTAAGAAGFTDTTQSLSGTRTWAIRFKSGASTGPLTSSILEPSPGGCPGDIA